MSASSKIHALAISLAACAAIAPPAAAGQPGASVSEPLVVTAPTDVDVRSVRIAYTAADMDGLQSRIRRAVSYVCGPLERELEQQRDRNACRTAAFASAETQIAEAAAAHRYAGVIVLAGRLAK